MQYTRIRQCNRVIVSAPAAVVELGGSTKHDTRILAAAEAWEQGNTVGQCMLSRFMRRRFVAILSGGLRGEFHMIDGSRTGRQRPLLVLAHPACCNYVETSLLISTVP